MQQSDDAQRSALASGHDGRNMTVEAALALSFSIVIGIAAVVVAAGFVLTR